MGRTTLMKNPMSCHQRLGQKMTPSKICTTCKKLLPLDAFGMDSRAKDGRQYRCLSCYREIDKVRRKTPEARAKHRAYMAQKSQDPEYRARMRVHRARYAEKNKDGIRAKSRSPEAKARARARAQERYRSDPAFRERIKKANTKYRSSEKGRAWYQNWVETTARDAWRAKRHQRRASRRMTENPYTAKDIREISAMQKGRCAICRISLKHGQHVDHIVALAAGGSNERSNIQLLCPSCNMNKKDKDPIEYMQSRGFLL